MTENKFPESWHARPESTSPNINKISRAVMVLIATVSGAAGLAHLKSSESPDKTKHLAVASGAQPVGGTITFDRAEVVLFHARAHLVDQINLDNANIAAVEQVNEHRLKTIAVLKAEASNQHQSQTSHNSVFSSSVSPNYIPGSLSDQQFLVCTRAHESDTSGGYKAISPGGQYFGAYQFLQSTWNNTAIHSGHPNLVGLRPDQASPIEQDSEALALKHWQGKAPWGDRC